MDNPTTESSNAPLNTDQAAAVFAEMLEPQEPEKASEADAAAAEQKAEAPAQEDPQQDPEVAADDDPMVTVKIDGKEVDVKLSELKNGYQRQQDYTRKTMEVSAERKQAEAQIQHAMQERQQYAQNLQRMQVQLESALQEQQQINWEQLIAENPQEALRQQHLAQVRQAQLQQNYAEQQRIASMMQAEQAQRIQSYLSQQQEQLLAKLPDWKDETKAKADKAALRDYLVKEGYDENAIAGVMDAKAVLIARKAMLYDQMVSKAQVATKKVANLPQKVERPGTGANPNLDRRSSAFQRLSKSGRVEDAAAVFASIL